MRALTSVLPSSEDLLALSPRQVAGFVLQLMNEAGDPRAHPGNLCSDAARSYPTDADRVVQRLDAALRVLFDEGYTMRDYKQVADGDWFTLSDKGRAIRDYRQLDEPEQRLESSRALVFVSCGQYAQHERELGTRLVELIERHTDCAAYFAENERTFEGLARNIIGALHRMDGMVFVMHHRGEVATPDGLIHRGSVWVEQEIAIAASLQQMGREIAVAGYVQQGIAREGLRQLLHLNPKMFTDDAEVVADFERLLLHGGFAIKRSAKRSRQEPMPLLSAEARMVGSDESRKLGLSESSATRLVVTVKNAGLGPAQDVVASFEGMVNPSLPEEFIGLLGAGDHVMRPFYCPRLSAGSVPAGSVPETIRVRYGGLGWDGGLAVVQRVAGSHPPKWIPLKGVAPTDI
jgi:hypothetical protein